MRLEILTPPEVEPLTVEAAKRWLGLWQDIDDDDGDVADAIAGCRDFLERRAALAMITQTLKETRVVPDGGVVRLLRAPIQEVLSVEVDGEALDDPPSLLPEGEARVRVGSPGQSVVITYRAGYGDGPEDVPARVRLVLRALLAWLWENRAVPGELPRYLADLTASLSWGGEGPPS